MMPRLAATESSQASALAGQCACGPSVVSIEVEPAPRSQMISRSSTMPTTTISASANATDFHNTARNGGANIWVRALMASSSIFASAGRQR